MVKPGDVISYLDMCREEGVNLQRGMNFKLCGEYSVILMSLRTGAPYADKVEDGARVLIYEGHDVPKRVDQPMTNPTGTLTQNGLFHRAAINYKNSQQQPEPVKVYEKIHSGIWVYNGLFRLVDARQEVSNARNVFKFRLGVSDYSTKPFKCRMPRGTKLRSAASVRNSRRRVSSCRTLASGFH